MIRIQAIIKKNEFPHCPPFTLLLEGFSVTIYLGRNSFMKESNFSDEKKFNLTIFYERTPQIDKDVIVFFQYINSFLNL